MTDIYKRKRVLEDVLEDQICNRCSKSTRVENNYEQMECRAYWGYESSWDNELWEIDLCQECSKLFVRWILDAGGKIDVWEISMDGDKMGEKSVQV